MDNFFRKGWRSILYILLFELMLAYAIPPTILHDIAWLNYFIDAVQHIAPFIGKIDIHNSAHPDVVRLFLALTLFLLIPKIAALYLWLNNRRNGSFNQLVVSPLTDTHAGGVGEYVAEPLSKGERNKPVKKRSWASRIIWSVLIFAFTAGMLWANLNAGSPDSSNSEIRDVYRYAGQGGVAMWVQWSVKQMTFLAFLLAISITVGRDYVSFFKQKFSNKNKGDK
jgi:hypothetical protein